MSEQPTTAAAQPAAGDPLPGMLHFYVAFDWGDEIQLDRAKGLIAADYHTLPRAPRTPAWIAYQRAPLQLAVAAMPLQLPELGAVSPAADITLFDFGAVGVALHVPFRMARGKLLRLAGAMSESEPLVQQVRAALEPLYGELQAAIEDPRWSELSEEYAVFHFQPEAIAPSRALIEEQAPWLAGLVRLEAAALSAGEIAEALRQRLSYSPEDLAVLDWAAAVVIDREGGEILETIAFANLQLLELRHIDQRLDRRLNTAYGLIHQSARTWLPFWRSHTRPLRALGELKVEANQMLERTDSALRLVGDPYLARVYGALSSRLHLPEWSENIRRSIAVLEGTYQVVADQVATLRAELLEIIIVLLILFEVVWAILGL